jgi:hypothetical protein
MLRLRGHPVEGQAYLSSEDASGRRSRHASAGPNEQALAKPSFEQRDLPADSALGQPEFHSGFRIASRPRKTRFCSDERGWLGLRRGVGFDFGGEDGQH